MASLILGIEKLIRDAMAEFIVPGSNVTATYDEEAGTLTISATGGGGGGGDAETIRDTIGAALLGGTNITVTPNDGSDTITISVSGLTKSSVGLSNVDNTSDANKPVSTLQGIAIVAAAGTAQSNATSAAATDATGKVSAHVAATDPHGDRAYADTAIADALETFTPSEGTGNGGFGPNWVAASNAPTSIKTAVLAAGGLVCDGTGDQVEINSRLANFKCVRLTEGQFNIAASLIFPRGRDFGGSGVEATILRYASGLTSRFIYVNNVDSAYIHDFTIDGASQSGSNITGIDMDSTTKTGNASWRQDETRHVIQRVQMHDTSGRGLSITGGFNRDCKIDSVDVFNAGTDAFYIASPDGKMSKCVAGSPDAYGFNINGAANWHFDNCKAWYAVLDGFTIGSTTASARITLTACEAQDCRRAGFRMARGNVITFNGCVADSNSNGSGITYSGFEIALSDPTTATSFVQGGVTLNGCVAYDKNELSRGYQQAYGYRFASGIKCLSFIGCSAGDNANHFNTTAPFWFNTPADRDNAQNLMLINANGTTWKSPHIAV